MSWSERVYWQDVQMPEPPIEPPADPDSYRDDEPTHFPSEGWYDSFGEWHYFEEDEDEID